MEVSGQLHAPAALPPDKIHRYRIGSETGRSVEDKKLQHCPCRGFIPCPPARRLAL